MNELSQKLKKKKKTIVKAFYDELKLAVNENSLLSLYSRHCIIKAIEFNKFIYFLSFKASL